jgi:general secretion pathway protein F
MWLAALAAAIAGWTVLNRTEGFRARWQRALLRVPVVGRLIVAVDTARFASTLAILTGSGAPLLRSLDAARDVVWALPLKAAATASARARA